MRLKKAIHLVATVLAIFLVVAPGSARAAGLTRLVAVAHQERVRAGGIGFLRIWDTTWWISVSAASDAGDLCRVNYSARFVDSGETRSQAGSFELSGPPQRERSGRIMVRCPTRPDYELPVRVRLQAETCDGEKSAWTESEFPVRDEGNAPAEPEVKEPAAQAAIAADDVVTTEAGADTSLAEVRAALDRVAHARGAAGVTGLRIVETNGERVLFAADVVRASPSPAPAPVATKVPEDALLGEIVMPISRR